MTSENASTAARALAARLLPDLHTRMARRRGTFVLGLSGLQGSGKSTLAAELVAAMRRAGKPAVRLSLDDVYLTRSERRQLAHEVHPLLATRGVPGTHDLGLLLDTLVALPQASRRAPVRLPRFDKGRDTRRPPSSWPSVTTPPCLVVFEGWCVGVRPQSVAALHEPVNALEREEDPDGQWRIWVNRRLRAYQAAWRHLDALYVLQAPSWRSVCRWRDQAEQERRDRGAPRAMGETELRRFMQHYERISRHALVDLPPRADRVIALDAQRRPRTERQGRPGSP